MADRMPRLTRAELTRIHESAIWILNWTGVVFHHPEAVEIFRQHGFKTDGHRVYFEESQVEEALDTAPSEFTLTGRDPERSVTVGGPRSVLLPCYGSPFVVEPDGGRRPGTLRDYQDLVKLVQTSTHLDMNGFFMVEPQDLPVKDASLNMTLANLLLCDLPFCGSPNNRKDAREALELSGLAFGGKKAMRETPRVFSVASSLSPLQFSPEMCAAMIEYATWGQPMVVANLVMSGTSGPIGLAGTLALALAEVLAGIVFIQLVNPGNGVVMGTTSCPTDMRTGSLYLGAPETSRITSLWAQIADYYNIPSRSGGCLTDAHRADYQAGSESALLLATTIRAGIDLVVHACGILSSYLAMSFEKFILDEELCGETRRLLEPIDLSDQVMALQEIDQMGPGGHFLTHPQTFHRFRYDIYQPEVLTDRSYLSWLGSGSRTAEKVAADKLQERLDRYVKPDIDPGLERDLRRYVAEHTG